MEKIFEYDNYRTFLKDYTARQKVADKKFSFRYFASKVGFSSHSFLDNVIHGRRNLTLESVRKKTKALNMDRKQAGYFTALVQYNQAGTPPEREEFFREMGKIRQTIRFYQVQESQYAYYAQ